nr:glucose 1-dehydrogenase [Frankia sp. QA3]
MSESADSASMPPTEQPPLTPADRGPCAYPLVGKVAVVTAASRGIGRAVARRLAADGAAVVVNWHTSATAAREVVAGIADAGGRAVAVRADLGDRGGPEALFTAAEETFGGVDILVNNAGITAVAPTADLDEDTFDRLFAVNVRGTFLALRLAARRLRDGGRIVNISTGYTLATYPNVGVYAGTKAAVEQMARSLSRELGPRRITVNTVLPGLVDTDGLSADVRANLDAFVAATPLGRIGEARDIADVVAFLAGDDARWVTGQAIVAAGGLV